MRIKGRDLLCYLVLATAVFLFWTTFAKSEAGGDEVDGRRSFASLEQSAEGRAPNPFVKRRLVPDLARLLSRAVPASAWDALARFVEGPSTPQRTMRWYLRSVLNWRPDAYPVLFSGYFVIWLSTLGFMIQCRSLTLKLYDVGGAAASWCGALFGVALLGGNGYWSDYPYDIPNAFVFTLALNALIDGRWWFPAAFAVAAYSKETSVLLLMAYALLRYERRWSTRYVVELVALGVLYVAIRRWIDVRYAGAPRPEFWYPMRNLKVLLKGMIQFMWVWWIVLVVVARMLLTMGELPFVLRRLIPPLLGTMIGLAFFLGWIDERRGYFEVLPLVGLAVLQWTFAELGLARYFRPRPRALEPT